MAMIKCQNCGRSVSDSEKVCPHCEEKIEKAKSCSKCGCAELSFSLKSQKSVYKCAKCGYEFYFNKNGEPKEYVGARNEEFNFFTAYLSIFKKVFDFKGRARRKEYWLATLAHILAIYVLYIAVFFTAFIDNDAITIPLVIAVVVYTIAVGIGLTAVEIRRLHDTGRSWTAYFVGYIPIVGQYIALMYLIEDSEFGANDYGPNPKGKE